MITDDPLGADALGIGNALCAKWRLRGSDADDVRQEAAEAVVRSLRFYNPGFGLDFGKFAYTNAYRAGRLAQFMLHVAVVRRKQIGKLYNEHRQRTDVSCLYQRSATTSVERLDHSAAMAASDQDRPDELLHLRRLCEAVQARVTGLVGPDGMEFMYQVLEKSVHDVATVYGVTEERVREVRAHLKKVLRGDEALRKLYTQFL